MSKTLISLLLALPLAAPAAATQYLQVVNTASSPLVAVAATPTGVTVGSQLSLAGRPLYPGQRLGVALHGPHRCRYDLRMVYSDGHESIARGFNVCSSRGQRPATIVASADEA